jgi:hypothetical protein
MFLKLFIIATSSINLEVIVIYIILIIKLFHEFQVLIAYC